MAFRQIQIVPSSNVMAVDYDEEAQTLVVTFVRGQRRYQYDGVPANVADEFANSGLTAGRVFRESILNRYPYQEV